MSGEGRAALTDPRVLFVGRTTLDVLYWLPRLPEEDTKTFAEQFHAAPGGPACNAAITCALLGGSAMLASAVGSGPWAAAVRSELERHQIELIDLADGTGYQTPLTTVLVGKERSTRTIVNPPMNAVKLNALQAWNASWGAVPPVVLSDGFHLKEALPLLAACRATGASLCLDGGSWKPGTDALAPLLNVAICSERFTIPGEPHTSEAIFRWFEAQQVPYIAVTRGSKPILVRDHGRPSEIEVRPIQAADTTGAGDVLHGAFCYEFARTGDFLSSLRRASEVATGSCEGTGIDCWARPS